MVESPPAPEGPHAQSTVDLQLSPFSALLCFSICIGSHTWTQLAYATTAVAVCQTRHSLIYGGAASVGCR